MWKIISCFLLILCFGHQTEAQGDVKISVYYEILCPDSIRFIIQQLFPVYKGIGKPLDIELVPYGFASVINTSGKLEFTCQHGPPECHGNKYHSCAIALFSAEERMEFVECSMSQSEPASDAVLRECSEKTGVSWTSLETCFNSGQADKLLLINGEKTAKVEPKINFIPTIVFNGQFNQKLQDDSMVNLKGVVCELLQYNPEYCKQVVDEVDIVLISK
ncbi:hypothetical protein JTB14_025055 [Gonioctena quinquepunctata]|nr:hypothetical protein JTB14_025055 [Gonioctena quinquepunctata]